MGKNRARMWRKSGKFARLAAAFALLFALAGCAGQDSPPFELYELDVVESFSTAIRVMPDSLETVEQFAGVIVKARAEGYEFSSDVLLNGEEYAPILPVTVTGVLKGDGIEVGDTLRVLEPFAVGERDDGSFFLHLLVPYAPCLEGREYLFFVTIADDFYGDRIDEEFVQRRLGMYIMPWDEYSRYPVPEHPDDPLDLDAVFYTDQWSYFGLNAGLYSECYDGAMQLLAGAQA